ncbi:MAG: hypothetical protein AAFQ57_12335 [Cyanobacteria bacterium J06626_14]
MDEILNPLCTFPIQPERDLVSDDDQGYLIRGYARLAQNLWDEGIADLEMAKKINPENALVCWTLGVFHKGKDVPRAILELDTAFALFTQQGNLEMAASSEHEVANLRATLNNPPQR